VRAQQLPVRAEAARRDYHAAGCPDQQVPAVPALQPADRPVHEPAGLRYVQVGLAHRLVQHAVRRARPPGRAVQRTAGHTRHPSAVGDQPNGRALLHHPYPRTTGGGGEPGEQQPARRAAAVRPVTAGCRRREVTGRGLAARVIQVVTVGRVGRLVRAEAPLERHAVAFQPAEHAHAVLAELAERLRRHHVAHLGAEVAEHRVRGIADAGGSLLAGAAAHVHDSARQRGGTAAGEPVEHHYGAARRGRLERGAGAGRAEADHDDVGLDIPVHRQSLSVRAENCNVF
jgi:hypothetical protein